jgi:SAM-dependent methyltransferase
MVMDTQEWQAGLLAQCQWRHGSLWTSPEAALSQEAQVHGAAEGVRLYERSLEEMSTSFFEGGLYRSFLEDSLAGLDRGEPILELGSGDGRITRYLLEMGFRRIVASDCNCQALSRFHDSLDQGERGRVAVLVKDLAAMDFPPRSLAAVVAIEVLCYFNEAVAPLLGRLAGWLRPGGLLVQSEPTLEGALTYSLAAGDWTNVESLIRRRRKVELLPGGQTVLSRVFAPGELEDAYRGAGLEVTGRGMTPTLNCLAVWAAGQAGPAQALGMELLREIRQASPLFSDQRCQMLCARRP